MAMWQPSVLETYGNQTTDYVNKTSGPMRKKYPNSMDDKELITSLTEVETDFPARALRVLGLLLTDGAPTVGWMKTFWHATVFLLRKRP